MTMSKLGVFLVHDSSQRNLNVGYCTTYHNTQTIKNVKSPTSVVSSSQVLCSVAVPFLYPFLTTQHLLPRTTSPSPSPHSHLHSLTSIPCHFPHALPSIYMRCTGVRFQRYQSSLSILPTFSSIDSPVLWVEVSGAQ